MTRRYLIAQARGLADQEGYSQPRGTPETAVAFTLRVLADELESFMAENAGRPGIMGEIPSEVDDRHLQELSELDALRHSQTVECARLRRMVVSLRTALNDLLIMHPGTPKLEAFERARDVLENIERNDRDDMANRT